MSLLLPTGAPRREEPGTSGAGPTPVGRTLTGLQFLLPVFAMVLLLAVPIVLFVAPLVAAGGTHLSVAVVVFAVMVVYCTARLGGLMWEAEPRWVALGVWMFSYTWIAVAGLTQSLADANPLNLTLEPDLAAEQSLLLLFGLVCYDVAGRLRPAGRTAATAAVPDRLRPRVLSPERVMLLAGVALVAAPVFVELLGGTTALLSSREAVSDTLSDTGLYSGSTNATGGVLVAVAGALPFVAMLCLGKLLSDDAVVRRQLLPWLLLGGLVVANLILNNPISNARYWAFAVVLAVLYTVRTSARPMFITLFVTAFTISALTVFPYLDAYRYSDETQQSQQQYSVATSSLTQPVDYVLGKTDYASVTDVAVIIRYVRHEGHTWGEQLLGAAAFWVPRPVWPDKPDNTAFLVADEIGFSNRNLDSPLWAEGYVDFGWVGTGLLLAGLGLLARRFDDALVALRGLTTTVGGRAVVPLAAVGVPIFAGYVFILLRGSLLQAMARIVVVLVLLLLVSRIPPGALSTRPRRGSPSSSPIPSAVSSELADDPRKDLL